MRFALILMMFVFYLPGCMPFWVHNYYSPNASEGTVTKSACRGTGGPPDRLQFIRNEVIISVRVYEDKPGIRIWLEVEIPASKEVRLNNLTVAVSIPSSPEPFIGTLEPHIDRRAPWNISEPLLGWTKEQKSFFGETRIIYKRYMMSTNIPMPKAETFKVRLPELFINNQEIVLQEVIFNKDKFLEFFVPLNC